MARGLGWSFLGVAIGLSEGIAARSLGKLSYGILGGAVGGFLGGSFFGLVLINTAGDSGWPGRSIARHDAPEAGVQI